MFEEVKEMIDSTIYTNGRGEVTAQNVNLAMHGIVDAAKDEVAEVSEDVQVVNAKIENLEKKIEEGGIGGLELKFPMILMELLEVTAVEEMYIDREKAAEIAAEMPFLKEPLDKMFEENAKAYAKYITALKNDETAPIINLNISYLYKEIIEQEMISQGVTYDYDIGMYCVASGVQVMNIAGIMRMGFTCMVNLGGAFCILRFLADGTCGIMEMSEPAEINLPLPGAEAYENDSIALKALESIVGGTTQLVVHTFQYYVGLDSNGHKVYEFVTPVHIKESDYGTNVFIRFIANTDLIEAVVNLESGLTTSRLLARMTPEEVDMIVEGNLKCDYSSVSAGSNTTVRFTIKSNVDWKLIENETVITEGTATSTNGTVYSHTINANTTTEVINHNYRLIAASDEMELSTVWVEQEAATESTVEE